ncbi:phage tail termination protein [Morganella morganii]|uniref:phage tail termination protein n=1 Tax=Morganella morganii TaxID=582 RepID=UPI001BDA6F17|nr:hypothetical protein [Morganella morganii]MBT0363665.1 hypothetical protein [Morganella morganii subsp. morganii]
MIHEAFERYLNRAGLLDNFIVQYFTWTEESESRTRQYAVIQPDGGNGRFSDLGADDNVMLILVSAQYDATPTLIRAKAILDYVASHPLDCELNSIYNLGGMPKPIPTEEGRFIMQLAFRCTS